jgi:hypothetical protein
MKFINFFLFLWVIFNLLDLEPWTPLNPDPIRIWIYNTGTHVHVHSYRSSWKTWSPCSATQASSVTIGTRFTSRPSSTTILQHTNVNSSKSCFADPVRIRIRRIRIVLASRIRLSEVQIRNRILQSS